LGVKKEGSYLGQRFWGDLTLTGSPKFWEFPQGGRIKAKFKEFFLAPRKWGSEKRVEILP